MNIKTFFGVPFYHSNIPLENEIIEFIKNLEYEKIKVNYRHTASHSKTSYVLNLNELYDLKKHILTHSKYFLHDILKISKNINFNLKNSWVMKHEKGDSGQKHFHNNSMYSGVVYLQVNDNTGYFSIHSKNTHCLINLKYDEYNQYNSLIANFLPQNGDIFLFPSDLEHSIQENESDVVRYCVAFNFFPEGDFSIGTISDLSLMGV